MNAILTGRAGLARALRVATGRATAAAGTVLLLAVPILAAAPVEFSADVVMRGDQGEVTYGHYWQKGDLIRVQKLGTAIRLQRTADGVTRVLVATEVQRGPAVTRVIDCLTGKVMIVDDSGKRYIPFRKPTVEADALPFPAIDWGLDMLVPLDSGTETIQGYDCDHIEYYGAKAGIEITGLPRAAREALAAGGGGMSPEKLMGKIKPDDLRGAIQKLGPEQRRLEREVWIARRLGRTIRHVSHGLGGGKIVTEFVSIHEGGLDPVLFQPPAGYVSVERLLPLDSPALGQAHPQLPGSTPGLATAPAPRPSTAYPTGPVASLVPKGTKATLRIIATLGGQPARAWVNVMGQDGREHLHRWPTDEGGILELSVPAGTYSVEATMDQVLGGAARRVDGVTVDGVKTVEAAVAVQAGFLTVAAEKNGEPCAARVIVIPTTAEKRWWPRDTDRGSWPLALAPGTYSVVVCDRGDMTPPTSGPRRTVQIEAGKTTELRSTLPAK